MDKRLRKISKQLTAYARGQFDKQLSISERMDDIDAIISGINMLGEEMKFATISRDYFNDIFNSVSDMVFVLDRKGVILDVNDAVYEQLGYGRKQLIGNPIRSIQPKINERITFHWLAEVRKSGQAGYKDIYFQTCTRKDIPVQVSVTTMAQGPKGRVRVLLTAKDITRQIQNENAVIRAIVDAQERERHRLAKDIHDGLGQQLSAVKFFIGGLVERAGDQRQKTKLQMSNEALAKIIADMRDICFALAPATLNEFGLIQAIRELCSQPEYRTKVRFTLKEDPEFPDLPKDMEIDIYRVIQEFVTNALTHGQAKHILINNSYGTGRIYFHLKEDGKGFEQNQSVLTGRGRGLKNVQSRIKSHQGELKITSTKGKGTVFKIEIPLDQ